MVEDTGLTLEPGMDDAALTQALRRASRNAEVLTIGGDLSAAIAGSPDWIALLAETGALPVVVAEGPVGPRGLALLLLADVAFCGPRSVWTGGDASGFAALAQIRLGPVDARALGLGQDPLARLVACGHVAGVDDPANAARAVVDGLPQGAARRLRQGWRAARDLPAAEALAYASWQFRSASQEVSDAR